MPNTQLNTNLETLRQVAREHTKNHWHRVQLELQTITPVYGGGTAAGEPDMLLPFRPRAIKSSLRHWWWLLNRHKQEYKNDSQLLYEDMTAIWGGASDSDGEAKRAKVRVRVELDPVEDDKVIPYMPFRITTDKETQQLRLQTTVDASHFYALWMLKPKSAAPSDLHSRLQGVREVPGHACAASGKKFADRLAKIPGLFSSEDMPVRSLLLPGIDWKLSLDMAQSLTQEQKIQVRDSIQAWLMLGGVGARTTRGLGRSQLKKLHTKTKAFQTLTDVWCPDYKWFVQAFGGHHVLRMDKASAAAPAWEAALSLYKSFRQSRQQDQNGRRMKQSYGHLANSLRKLTGKDGHPLPQQLKDSHAFPMPEVMFGAPVVYQFISRRGARPEPSDGEIRVSDRDTTFERYTSPLLVICVHLGNGRFVPAALRFQHHASDILDKNILVKGKNATEQIIPSGKWWPNLSTVDGQNEALDWLSEAYRNQSRPEQDPLYEELLDAAYREDAPTNGDPLLVYLNFFRAHPL